MLLLAPRALGAQPLTESSVIRLAKARDPDALAARAAVVVAESEAVRAGLYPNPSVSWEREHVSSGSNAGEEREDSFFLTVPIELGGRRSAQKALARSGAATARARAAQSRSEAVTTSLAAFYEALAAERDLEIAELAVAVLDEASRVVARRYEEGTTSGYERSRLEIEAELARSRLNQAAARVRTARASLGVLLGIEPAAIELQGDFGTVDAGAGAGLGQRRSTAFLRTAATDANDARGAAGFAWVPSLSLSGGFRIVEEIETRYGYVAGVSLSLPIFSWGQELRAEASARKDLADAELRATERATRLHEVRAREQLTSARQELARFVGATGERVDILEKAVQSGYREGDRSVLELVDAERARIEVERRRLELQLLAKKSELELRAARGEFE